jgi:hypothetical protein
MEQVYLIREAMIVFYKKHQKIIMPILKFIMGFFIFITINKSIGYAKEIMKIPFVLLLSILTMMIPIQWFFVLVIFVVSTHLFFVSMEVAILTFGILMVIQLLYVRLFPKESLLIIAILICYYLKIPYAVPLFAGLFIGISAIIPTAIGTFIWYFIPHISTFVEVKSNGDLFNMPDIFAQLYISMINAITGNQTWIVTTIVFAGVITIVYFLGKLEVDYGWYLAIAVGAGVNIIGFMIAMMMIDIQVGALGLFGSTIGSAALVMLVQFFYCVVDYSSAEKVQFEDEDNYYYVKVVPKIMIARSNREIRRITREPYKE